MYAGIDEAGRGPVLGPLVVAGVACPDPQVLADMGVKDSKKLSPAKRVRLDRLIRATPGLRVATRCVDAAALDARGHLSMNDIEVQLFHEIALELGAAHVTVDAADVNAERFGRRVAEGLPPETVMVSEHKADDNHVVVAAASIIAKVQRDAAILELGRRLERRSALEMGSGYSHDPRTRAFLAAWIDTYGDLPEGTRRSWKPARTLVELHQMPRLETFAADGEPSGNAGMARSKARGKGKAKPADGAHPSRGKPAKAFTATPRQPAATAAPKQPAATTS